MPPTIAQLVSVRSQLAEAVLDYLRKLEERLDRTPWFRGGKLMAASDIAVPVRVLKEVTRPEPPPPGARDFDNHEAKEPEHREAAREYTDPEIAALYEEPGRVEKKQEEVPWSQERLQVHRAVVLGGPGCGKSFLTQTTALELVRQARDSLLNGRAGLDVLELPLHFTLAAFANPGLPPDPLDAVFALVEQEYSPGPVFLAWLEERLKSATTWLLLDALDEVQGGSLHTLNTRLSAMASQDWNSRVILTCRPANYSRAMIPWGELTEYELAPFNPLEVRQFASHWFASDKPRAEALVQALGRNYSLAHAARVPLLATFLCLAHEEAPVSGTTRRVELYARVVRGLVRRAWKQGSLASTHPHVDALIGFLIRIGRPLFVKHPAGNLFTHTEVMGVLGEAKRRPRAWINGKKETNEPDDLLEELLETGLLVGAGLRDGVETQFSFAHRSLLEYFVALSLNDEARAKGWSSIAGFVDKTSWHPAWRETILFLAGVLANPQPLLALLADPATDDMTLQRLCLAGRCLPELSLHRGSGSALAGDLLSANAEQIAHKILGIWLENEERAISSSHLSDVLPSIGAACTDSLVAVLLEQFDENAAVKHRLVKALGRMGPAAATGPVLCRLNECLRHASVCDVAAEALGRMGAAAATEEVITCLSECLLREVHKKSGYSFIVAETLGRLASAAQTEATLSRLADCLRAPEFNVRIGAVNALAWLPPAATTAEEVVSRLSECLRDASVSVRIQAGWTLRRLGCAAAVESEVNRLLQCVLSPNWSVRSEAIMALGQLGAEAATDAVLSQLIDSLRNDPWRANRCRAATALGYVGPAARTKPVVDSLADCLCGHWAVCFNAAEALGRLGPAAATETVLTRLTQCLRWPLLKTMHVHEVVAQALGVLVAEAASEAVVSRLSEDLHGPAKYLGVRAASEATLKRLIDCLRDPTSQVHHAAEDALARLGLMTETEPVLCQSLRNAEGQAARRVLWYAQNALKWLGPEAATNMVVNQLTGWLGDEDWQIRSRAVTVLGSLGPAGATLTTLNRLNNWLRNPNERIRSSAAEALSEFSRAGIRWFAKPDGSLLVSTVAELSEERS